VIYYINSNTHNVCPKERIKKRQIYIFVRMEILHQQKIRTRILLMTKFYYKHSFEMEITAHKSFYFKLNFNKNIFTKLKSSKIQIVNTPHTK